MNQKTAQILLVCAVAIAIRFYGLLHHDFWMDEVLTALYAKSPLESASDSHTPFFYWITHFFAEMSGYGKFGLRAYPFALSSALLVYLGIQAIRNRNLPDHTWEWVFLVYAVAGLDWVVSREARMYGPMLTFSTVSLLLGLRYIGKPKSGTLILFTLFQALNAFNHAAAALYCVSLACTLIWINRREKKTTTGLVLSCFTSITPTLAFYFFSPEKLATALTQIGWIPSPAWHWSIGITRLLLGHRPPQFVSASLLVDAVVVLLVSGVIVFALRRYQRPPDSPHPAILFAVPIMMHLLALLLLLPWPFISEVNLFLPRYFIPIFPVLVFIFSRLQSRVSPFRRTLPLLMIVSAFSLYNVLQLHFFRSQPTSARQFMQFIAGQSNETRVLCDYDSLLIGYAVLIPSFDPAEWLTCRKLAHESGTTIMPNALSVFSSGPDANNRGLISAILDANYKETSKQELPCERSLIERYQAKAKR